MPTIRTDHFRAFAAAFALLLPTTAFAAEAPRLAVLPFSYLDTSFEPRDQSAEHARRLAAMVDDLRTQLDDDLYAVLPAEAHAPAAACPAGDSECILKAVRAGGGELVLAGAVQKISTMATRVWVGVFDVATGAPVYQRELNFRGDTDEAWHRAALFVAEQVEAAEPKPR
jgi:hypothetical protein